MAINNADTQSKNNSYVYLHKNPLTGDIFYVGISGNNRGGKYFRANRFHSRSVFWKNCVKQHGFDVEIFKEKISWEEACSLERALILKYGRRDIKTGILVNLTEGGEGVINKSDEFRKRVSLSMKKSWENGRMDVVLTPVFQYSNEGVMLMKFESQTEAQKLTGIGRTEISRCIRGRTSRAGGYYWSFSDNLPSIPKHIKKGDAGKVGIIGYDINTEKIFTFESGMDAEKHFGISGLSTSISKCIKGDIKKANDIIWYKSEHNKYAALLNRKTIRCDRMVVRIDKKNNVEFFNTLKDACSSTLGADARNVSACIFGKQPTAYGYKWKKLKDYNYATT